MKALKRIVLGSLLFLTLVLLSGCDSINSTESTTVTTEVNSSTIEAVTLTTEESTTISTTESLVESQEITVEIITSGDNPFTGYVEEEYVSKSMTIVFESGDSLLDLLRENFEVYCADESGGKDESCSYDGGFGRYLVAIDSLDATTVNNGYISFYIDGAYAMSGVDATVPEDGKVYSFKLETY